MSTDHPAGYYAYAVVFTVVGNRPMHAKQSRS